MVLAKNYKTVSTGTFVKVMQRKKFPFFRTWCICYYY